MVILFICIVSSYIDGAKYGVEEKWWNTFIKTYFTSTKFFEYLKWVVNSWLLQVYFTFICNFVIFQIYLDTLNFQDENIERNLHIYHSKNTWRLLCLFQNLSKSKKSHIINGHVNRPCDFSFLNSLVIRGKDFKFFSYEASQTIQSFIPIGLWLL